MGSTGETIMQPIEFWRLRSYLSLHEAAALIVGADPSEFPVDLPDRPRGYQAAHSALLEAIKSSQLPASGEVRAYYEEHSSVDWTCANVRVADLLDWPKLHNINAGFFFQSANQPSSVANVTGSSDGSCPAQCNPKDAEPAKPSRRGPKLGTIDRLSEKDRALIPEMRRIIDGEKVSAKDAARRLIDQIAGSADPENKIRRLVTCYYKNSEPSTAS
jgi:hypothetical protein